MTERATDSDRMICISLFYFIILFVSIIKGKNNVYQFDPFLKLEGLHGRQLYRVETKVIRQPVKEKGAKSETTPFHVQTQLKHKYFRKKHYPSISDSNQ